MNTNQLRNRKPHKSAIAIGVATAMAAFSTSVLAEEENAVKAKLEEQGTLEVVEVTGVRASLENALNTKRQAASIVDAISATDIDALPALDLGEALQALPGIQLNSESEGRQSTISLRGLSSGFVKTTAFGQSFATPTPAGGQAVGAPNPFSSFEAGIFDGVTVVKSPTADLQEGGMAGIVDKKLQQALSKKDGFNISIGARYEELPESTNPEYKLSGVKSIIEDKLAVAFKFSTSKQEFRRDTFDIIDYTSAEDTTNAGNTNGGVRATNVAEYRAMWNIPVEDEIRVPQKAKNVTQYSDGDRYSFSGNIEFRATDEIKLGAHVLISERSLDDGTKEVTNFETGLHRSNPRNDFFNGQVTIDMDVAPFPYTALTEDGTGGQAWIAPALSFQNGKLQNENRKTTFQAETEGLMLYGDFVNDDWVLGARATISEATNEFTNIGVGYNHQGNRNATQTPSGFNGYINTGRGNLGDIRVEGSLDVPFVYDGLDWPTPNITQASVSVLDDQNQGRRLNTYVNGRTRDLYSSYDSVDFNAQRFLDFGIGEGLRFDAVKVGARYSTEKIDSVDRVHGLGGVDPSNFGSSYLSNEPLSAVQSPFFDGKIPGTFDETNGWVTLDNEATIAAYQTGLETDRTQVVLPASFNGMLHESVQINRAGFWDRSRTSGPTAGLAFFIDYNYEVEQELTALYAMTDFSGNLPAGISYNGNIGVRYVETDNTFDGVLIDDDENGVPDAVPFTFKDSYDNLLPMMNVAFNLTDDIVLRAAYYESIVRPNINGQRPAPTVQEGNSTVTLNLPNATLEPYEGENYEVSLEWYNRAGSAISVGFFQKDISNLFDNNTDYCPQNNSDPLVTELIGEVELVGDQCQQVALFTPEDTGQIPPPEPRNRDVNIRNPVNSDDDLKLEGFELAIQQKLDFLPYPWDGFGGVFNYTKLRQSGDAGRLERVSPESYNLIGYWENDGISLRLSYNWRDDQITAGANAFLGTGVRTIKEKGRLDFSGSYKITKKTKLFLQAFNLTDEITTSHYGYTDDAIHQLSYNGRIYKVSVSHRF